MLVTLKQCLDSVVEYEMQSRQIGNIKVERDKKNDKTLYVYHYNNLVAIIDAANQLIVKNYDWWNCSRSTTRLCNDLINYFYGYDLR